MNQVKERLKESGPHCEQMWLKTGSVQQFLVTDTSGIS